MKRSRWIVAMVAVCGLVAAASTTAAAVGGTPVASGAPELAGTTVTIAGPAGGQEGEALQQALNVFADANEMTITYSGSRDFEAQINAQAAGGNPPDIATIQPGKIVEFAAQEFILPLPESTLEVVRANWDDRWLQFGTVDETVYAVISKTDLKSLVWYNTSIFADGGYEVPETWEDLKALSEQMIADGITPWCVGIESGPATGWPFTDWVEDLVLRLEGPEFYDQWVAHEVPSDSPEIAAIWQDVIDLWNTPGAVYAAGGSIASTPFGDNGQPLVDGDCAMHKQANFFASFLPEGTTTGPGGAIDVFGFPGAEAGAQPALTATTNNVAFRDAPEVWAVMEYLSNADYAAAHQQALSELLGGGTSGFLSAANDQDLSVYNELERVFIDLLASAEVARFDFDASVPSEVEAAFWTEGTSAVNGDKSIEDALATIEDAWE